VTLATIATKPTVHTAVEGRLLSHASTTNVVQEATTLTINIIFSQRPMPS